VSAALLLSRSALLLSALAMLVVLLTALATLLILVGIRHERVSFLVFYPAYDNYVRYRAFQGMSSLRQISASRRIWQALVLELTSGFEAISNRWMCHGTKRNEVSCELECASA
jgi:hypothetical protein